MASMDRAGRTAHILVDPRGIERGAFEISNFLRALGVAVGNIVSTNEFTGHLSITNNST